MDKNSSTYYDIIAKNLIKKLEMRHMQGHYVETVSQAKALIYKLMETGGTISWGGSETIEALGIINEIKKDSRYRYIDRLEGKDSDAVNAKCLEALTSDYYLMSSNAITREGELVNIDGKGNRIQALIFGPKNVVVVVGINKIIENLDAAENRIKNIAAPMNAIRLNRDTPCKTTGQCFKCLSPQCMCSHLIITRNSFVKNRIKVIIVKETLGY